MSAPDTPEAEPIDPSEEARGLVSSARALVAELSEEGVHEFERAGVEPSAAPIRAGAERTAEEPSAPARTPRTTPARPAMPEPPSSAKTLAPEPGVAEAVPWEGRTPSLDEVRAHLGDCQRCALAGGRNTIVFGDGDPQADLMFIGEGPGEQEDRRGLPFVGRAGELLTQMIEKGIGLARSDVYICNIVKCRPPGNRNPLPPEVGACRPFLQGQIAAVAPKVIITLGKPAASLLLGRDVAITRVRGTWQDYQGIPLMPTLHPAYVLRQYTAENRRAVWQDLQAAVQRSRS